MEIQWLIPVTRMIDYEGFISLLGIFHAHDLDVSDVLNITFATKIRYMPQETLEEKELKLTIKQGDIEEVYLFTYPVPSISKWLDTITYLGIPIQDIKLVNEGTCEFILSVDESEVSESILVGHFGGVK